MRGERMKMTGFKMMKGEERRGEIVQGNEVPERF